MQIKQISLLLLFSFYYCLSIASQFQYFTIENKAIDESSGLAASIDNPELLWTHNDSGNMPIIYAMDYQGRDRGTFFLDEVSNRDWEDMASFYWNQQAYLLIADSGDNYQMYLSSFLYIFKEPSITPVNPFRYAEPRTPAWVIEYNFDDGKLYDIEAVAIDIQSNKILMLTKRTNVVNVFELPLLPRKDNFANVQVLTAKKITQLDYIKNPTAMDISSNAQQAAILSYGRVYLFNKSNRQSWAESLAQPTKIIKYKGMYQPEAICFAKQNTRLYISSEKLPAKLLSIDLD